MRTRLRLVANDTCLVLPRAVLQTIGASADEDVEVEVEGDAIVVRPIREDRHNPVARAFHSVIENPEEINPVRTAGSIEDPVTRRARRLPPE